MKLFIIILFLSSFNITVSVFKTDYESKIFIATVEKNGECFANSFHFSQSREID